MNCPKCGAGISIKMNRCSGCGQKLEVYQKIINSSNAYFNVGLEQAKIRDLSGAINSLKKSLKLYKCNTNARNLLALIYYEMGETVSALREWVISNHLQPEGNEAAEYMEMIQSNTAKLDSINQTIKKYNASLAYARQKSVDLAIIQLKKVTGLNPKFVRAHQLLALLYMQEGEREKAARCLMRARQVDINNTTTLKYLETLQGEEVDLIAASKDRKRSSKIFHGEPVSSIMPVTSYKEEKPRVLPFINVLIGIIIGLAVAFILIRPTLKKESVKGDSTDIVNYGEQLAAKNGEISSLENANSNLQNKVDELEKTISAYKEEEEKNDTQISPLESYDVLFEGVTLYMDKKEDEAAEALLGVEETDLLSDAAKELYTMIQEATFEKASKKQYEQGRTNYNNKKYEDALPFLEKALKLNPDNVDAIYFLGRLYHQTGKKEKAAEQYNKIIDDYPQDRRVGEAKNRITELGLD